ncbi:cyclin-dependent protein kinase inhibitor SMR3-like [Malania oleifera]|uniref:cyclin-dependent protein kinase inhibitor SMR3-like n=1 Tax=Malania oleifera TaxID=397392 RepID=UPI0025AE63DA|nr:cyclin-dependent protein kinase inhibitor SMR3-like [Malania oleifera]
MSNPEFFLLKGSQQQIQLSLLTRPALEFPDDGCHPNASHDRNPIIHHVHHLPPQSQGSEAPLDLNQPGKCEKIAPDSPEKVGRHDKPSISISLTGTEPTDNNDDEDGFRTPTSLEHRIPEPKQCPPAPRRSPCRLRLSPRKVSSATRRRRSLNLDLLREIEEFFGLPTDQDDDRYRFDRKMKRARRDDVK